MKRKQSDGDSTKENKEETTKKPGDVVDKEKDISRSLDPDDNDAKTNRPRLFDSEYFPKSDYRDFAVVVLGDYFVETGKGRSKYDGAVFHLSRDFIRRMYVSARFIDIIYYSFFRHPTKPEQGKDFPMLEWIRDSSASSVTVSDYHPSNYEWVFRMYQNPHEYGTLFCLFVCFFSDHCDLLLLQGSLI